MTDKPVIVKRTDKDIVCRAYDDFVERINNGDDHAEAYIMSVVLAINEARALEDKE
jgi:hypothetical protein